MRKENLILGGIFVGLLILAFAFEPIKDWAKKIGGPDNFLKKVKIEEVLKINLEKNGEEISLRREGEKWKIFGTKDFYVKSSDEIFLSYIEEAIKADFELVSDNPDNKSEFGTDDSGVRVSLEDNDKVLATFVVGNMTDDFSSSYISLPDSGETYKVEANLSFLLNREVDTWYNEAIFSSDKELINKMRFQYPRSEFTVEKIEDTWKGTVPYSFSVNEEKINEILEIMTNLIASDIPAQTFEGTGLENHSIIVEASGEDVNNVLMVGGENEEGYFYAKRGDSDNIYLISPAQKELLQRTITSLR